MNDLDSIHAYDYVLPEELIARSPVSRRDASRLLVVDRRSGTLEHRHFSDLPHFLKRGDLLVLNDTRVVPAKLAGIRTSTGGKWDGLYLRDEQDGHWRIIGQTRGHLQVGETLTIERPSGDRSNSLILTLVKKCAGGEWIVKPGATVATPELLHDFGTMPLPHYMHRDADESDLLRYQTVYAMQPGAVAAPTAGLHFTPEVFQACDQAGIRRTMVTLHVGLGTFRPVKVDQLSEHQMHAEWCEISAETVDAIRKTKSSGGRVVSVGTTSVRTLETAAHDGEIKPFVGETSLFIRPPFEFQVVDALLTNFHLPKSTLLVLVSTFAGRELIRQAYAAAIRERYRFFSYGDAMLII